MGLLVTAWLAIAVEKRKRAGDGYDDQPTAHYSWDETVPNATAVARGDIIVLWDTDTLLGLSVIEDIEVSWGEKETRSCPHCGKADVASRKTKTPEFVCWKCKHAFDQPVRNRKTVKCYRSRHEIGWVDLRGRLSGDELRRLCEKPKSQLSFRALRWDDFRRAIEATDASMSLSIVDSTRDVLLGGHSRTTARVRRGQPAFRAHLMETYGSVCAFTGPAPGEALEAAHLYSYAATGKHHRDGGLLLRRDLHRLFDLGLIAVNPESFRMSVHQDLSQYADFYRLDGHPLAIEIGPGQARWLATHWEMHRAHDEADDGIASGTD